MGPILGSIEQGGGQSHKPGVQDGERHDTSMYPKEAGAECALKQTVGSAGQDPREAY